MTQHANGPVALVTGGASGIGRAIVDRLAADGYRVAVIDLQPATESESVLPLVADVSSQQAVVAAVEAAAARWDRLDAVVNCAGTIEPNDLPLLESEATLDRVIAVNLKGPLWVAAAAFPYLQKRGGGAIVNIGSIAARRGSPVNPIYAATKAGLHALTVSLARRWARNRVRVNTICPGSVAGTGFAALQLGGPPPAARQAQLMAKIPLGRLATPEDVAAVTAFLLSDAARHITGTAVDVDGGETLGL